ncbi:cache domain-containing protein [Clostridium sp. AM58-1XD]|uniref:cache domain-containing protein n=1 Tax=Clostridium sp. AM58-1XD TaxID=2292307 RepID=UPI001FA9173B|nr:cache domain-containing protein [Clostridium sp. AM58-1XD]
MEASHRRNHKRAVIAVAVFLIINILAVFLIIQRENRFISSSLSSHGSETRERFEAVMDHYERSFHLFVQMMSREIQNNPDPDTVQDYLKSMDTTLLGIEGETYDGLYMYYQGRYLYSWDTPYSVYEDSGYVATERPWYKDAEAGKGRAVFTPPYMSYANHYILTTISQLQPDGETVFAYDIKMGDIQNLVSSMNYYNNEQIMIYDRNGTVIGSTNEEYLGGNLQMSVEEAANTVSEAEAELQSIDPAEKEEISKAEDKVQSAAAFYEFQKNFSSGFEKVKISSLAGGKDRAVSVSIGGKLHYAVLNQGEDFNFLVLVPVSSAYMGTLNIWLVPLLLVELLLIYISAESAGNGKTAS